MEIQSMSKFYRHEPLPEPTQRIRLLSIHEGNWDDDICCEIQVHELSSAPEYQAISYTWGAEAPIHTIEICGKKFEVRHNCSYALKQARLYKADRLIWVDSVCINQYDKAEKAAQVRIMGDIYQQAGSVLACVGPAADESMFIFDNVTEIARIRKKHRCRGCEQCSYVGDFHFARVQIHVGYEWLLNMEPSQMTRFEDAFNEFASRVYWSRLWIVQELFLAQNVNARILCGDRSLPINDLRFAWGILDHLRYPNRPDDPICRLAKREGKTFHYRGEDGFDFIVRTLGLEGNAHCFQLEILGSFLSTLGCANPLDRIYGILKLIEWPESCGPPNPDYNETLCELVVDVTNRLGRRWSFPSDLGGICFGLNLGVELEKEGESRIAFLLGHREDLFRSDTTTTCQRKCSCDCSIAPRVAMTKDISRYGVVYNGSKDTLFVTMYAQCTPTTHVELQFYRNEVSNHYAAILADPEDKDGRCIFLFWSSVQIQAGDIIADFDLLNGDQMKDDKELAPSLRYCVVLRDAGHDYYKICGSAEIYGYSQWCLEAKHCSDRRKTRACSGHSQRKRHFILCLDAQDALSYLYFGRRPHHLSLSDLPTREQLSKFPNSWPNISFTRTRFSSYAMEIDTIKSEEEFKGSPFEVMDVPTTDQQFIICANCGGRFNPEDPLGGVEDSNQ